MKKYTMTAKQVHQFNEMRIALRRIKAYDSPEKIRKSEEVAYLEYEEVLEMAYDNMQSEANIVNGIREIKILNP